MRNPDNPPPAPIFVVGCPRSGTTLVRNLLNSHPQVALLPYETHLLDRYGDRLRQTDLKDPDGFDEFWKCFITETKYDRSGIDPTGMRDRWLAASGSTPRDFFTCLMETYAETQNKPFFGEKTPGHFRFVEQLWEWYPHARILLVVRDPRAVLTSWLTLRTRWTRVPHRDVLERWRESIRVTERWLNDPRTQVVVYERLVSKPTEELAAIIRFLGVPDPAGPSALTVRVDRAERWKSTLFPAEVRMVEAELSSEMLTWGYEPARPTPVVTTIRAARTRSAGFLRWTAARVLRTLRAERSRD